MKTVSHYADHATYQALFKQQMKEGKDQAKLDLVFDGNTSELEKQSEERRKMFSENEEL